MAGEEKTRAMLLEEINEVMNRLTEMKDGFYARQLESLGLTLLQFTGLQAIDQRGPDVSIGEIGEAIGAPPSTMTSLTNRLVALGYIERYTPPDNRRAVLLKTTELGAKLVYQLRCEREEDVEAIFEAMTDDQLAYLTSVLHSLVENIARRLAEKRTEEH
jgi:MarR family transcriptional regulator, organic hydroperoxide resistance regulator